MNDQFFVLTVPLKNLNLHDWALEGKDESHLATKFVSG